MREQVIKEILNTLDVNAEDIAFDKVTYKNLISTLIDHRSLGREKLHLTSDIFSNRMRKLFPEKEEKSVNWHTYILSLVPYGFCTICKNILPLSNFHKSSNRTLGIESSCKKCELDRCKKYRNNNYEQRIKSQRKYRERNPNKDKEYYENNKEKISKSGKKYRKENLQKVRLIKKKHYENNKEMYFANASKRRAAKLQATPAWYEKELVTEIYKQSSIETHIDHIIPLVNKMVCGLHCIDNLQAISAKENLSKSNSFEQDFESMEHMEWLLNNGVAC